MIHTYTKKKPLVKPTITPTPTRTHTHTHTHTTINISNIKGKADQSKHNPGKRNNDPYINQFGRLRVIYTGNKSEFSNGLSTTACPLFIYHEIALSYIF